MWKILNILITTHRHARFSNITQKIISRNFLSQAYYCQEVWNHRLKSPLFEKVNLDELYHELEQSYQQNKNISAVDVDIFANTVNNEDYIGELRDLIHKLRMSADCGSTLKSTGHAVTRLYLDTGKTEEFLEILDDRLNYGIFLDAYDANILMNKFLQSKEYSSAARVAIQLMLQEDFSHKLASSLAVLSCYLYIKDPVGWPPLSEPEPESKDEVKVRVKYIRNPYFDDHFDLKEANHLIGKTLLMICSKTDDCLSRSLHLLGLSLYNKNEQAVKLIQSFKSKNKTIYSEILSLLENNEDILNSVKEAKLEEGNITELLEDRVRNAEKECSEKDIAEQCKIYSQWEKARMSALEEQKQRLLKENSLREIDQIQEELKKKEQLLWFFDNEEKLDLQIEDKVVYYPKKWFGKKKKPKTIDESYIPPEVQKRND